MKRGILEFRPQNEVIQPLNNPVNNLLTALMFFIDSVVDDRVNKQVEKRLGEINFQSKEVEQKAEEKDLVKAKDVAKHLKFAESTINDMADRGEIPCTKHVRGKRTFRRFDLEAVKSALKV